MGERREQTPNEGPKEIESRIIFKRQRKCEKYVNDQINNGETEVQPLSPPLQNPENLQPKNSIVEQPELAQ